MSIKTLVMTVQKNCDIADAKYARSHSMCIYLMKMRGYFRWEKGALFSDEITKGELGDWIKAKEDQWDCVEDQEFQLLNYQGVDYRPFDSVQLNQQLVEAGYVYSAGYGQRGRPHFFIAKIDHVETLDGFQVYYSNQELARDLSSPPAMRQGDCLFVKEESYRRFIWDKIEEWQWFKNKNDTAMGKVLQTYDFDNDPTAALERIVQEEKKTVVWHEVGEWRAGMALGDAWLDMLPNLLFHHENMARAVKDLYADCLETLPNLLNSGNDASIHFYFAHLQTTRKALFPKLVLAYQKWRESGVSDDMRAVVDQGVVHWHRVAKEMLDLYGKNQLGRDVQKMIKVFRLV